MDRADPEIGGRVWANAMYITEGKSSSYTKEIYVHSQTLTYCSSAVGENVQSSQEKARNR